MKKNMNQRRKFVSIKIFYNILKDTLAQMEEFRKTLEKMTSGDMSLIDLKGRVQLVIIDKY